MPLKIKPVEWAGDHIRILDQTRLPFKEKYLELYDYRQVARAIKKLQVRGAPAIGIAAAYGIALGAMAINTGSRAEFLKRYRRVVEIIAGTRPTARNLFMAVERMEKVVSRGNDITRLKQDLLNEAIMIHREEEEATGHISRLGAELIKDGATVLTHCNTGPLATGGYGTALGIIITAFESGKSITVYADETRPLLQGARLTAWELQRAGIPVVLITDSMAGYFMQKRRIDCIIVGADRITAGGDTANKIGTYSLAVLAAEHRIPFYVAAPTSTIDLSLNSGDDIIIEERSPEEVTGVLGKRIAPEGVAAANPAFDVTPCRYISAIITEKGIVGKPFRRGLKNIFENSEKSTIQSGSYGAGNRNRESEVKMSCNEMNQGTHPL